MILKAAWLKINLCKSKLFGYVFTYLFLPQCNDKCKFIKITSGKTEKT